MAFNRRAEIELTTNNRKLKAGLKEAEKDMESFGRKAKSGMGSAFKGVLGGFAAYGSISGIADLGREVMATEENLTRIGIQAGFSNEQIGGLRDTAGATARRLGMMRTEVLGAVTEMVDLEGTSGASAEKMVALAEAAQATGAPIQELAGVAFALNNAFKLDGPGQLEGALNAVISAGKEGSVPLGEMSAVLQQLSTAFARVSSSGKDGAADLAAAIQIGRLGFGSAAEAGTGIMRFIDQLELKAPKLKAFARINVYEKMADGTMKLKPLREQIDMIANSKLMRDPTLMTQVFESSEARQFLRTIIANRAEFDLMADTAKTSNDVQKDLQAFLASNAGRMKIALSEAKSELEALVTPERIKTFVRLVEKGVKALDYVTENLTKITILLGAMKLAPMLIAMNQWGRSMQAVAANATQASGSISSAAAQSTYLSRGASAFAGKFAAAASSAAGIATALLAGYQAGTMLVEAMGWFEDEHQAVATADDPRAKAATAREMREQAQESHAENAKRISEYTAQLERQRGPGNRYENSPEAIAKTEQLLAAAKARAPFEESQLRSHRAQEIAATIFERDQARGSNASDDVLRVLGGSISGDMLSRVGSGLGEASSLSGNTVIKEFAPELASARPEERQAILGALQKMLDAQERVEEIRRQVAETQPASQEINVKVELDGNTLLTAMGNTQAGNRAPPQ